MAEYSGGADTVHRIKLSSTLENVVWTRGMSTPGAMVGLEILTNYVGTGAEMEITLSDNSGKTFGTYSNKLYGNRFNVEVLVPEAAEQAFYASVKLPKHGLTKKSAPLILLPNVSVTNAKWSQPEARRGDILTLTADVPNAPEGMEALVTVYEYDVDGAHEEITKVVTLVEQERVKLSWEFQFPGNVQDIPGNHETEAGYSSPQFFFRVDVLGKGGDSPMLTFKDWVELKLVNSEGEPVPNAEYELHLPDGTTRTGVLNAEAYAREEDLPPGVCIVVFSQPAEPAPSEAG